MNKRRRNAPSTGKARKAARRGARKSATTRSKASSRKAGAKRARAAGASINFIPNDPLAVSDLPMRSTQPRADRLGKVAKFDFSVSSGDPAQHPPGTAGFLFWQSREAALAAMEAVEAASGPLTSWAPKATQPLRVIMDAGDELNAYYNQNAVSFFHHSIGNTTTFSGASTDCVSHEIGHAILDALRPDLFDSGLPEHAAFHEAFGDCVALLTALSDGATRQALLAKSPDLSKGNFVEALLEDLSAAILRAEGPNHPAAKPRHALNAFQWRLPSSLPTFGGPDELTGEEHSFGRIFVGAFYDTIRNIFASYSTRNAATLLKASRAAASLLVEGARNAVENARFFESVGVSMLAADIASNAGANRSAIAKAFEAHGIALAIPARAFQERSLLVRSRGKKRQAVTPTSPKAVTNEVRRRLGAVKGARIGISEISMGTESGFKYVYQRPVDLTGIVEALAGVSAYAPEPVVVAGQEHGYAAVRSALPESHTTEDEVRFFVATLMANQAVASEETQPMIRKTARAVATVRPAQAEGREARSSKLPASITHIVQLKGNKRVLTRIRFSCCRVRDDEAVVCQQRH